jgi:hypothetical protein
LANRIKAGGNKVTRQQDAVAQEADGPSAQAVNSRHVDSNARTLAAEGIIEQQPLRQ